MCCGMVGALLLWGRVAAAAIRLSQAVFLANELRIQCFVDDPAIVVRGTQFQRRRLTGMLLLFWLVLGLRISWGKGVRENKVPWIGASVRLSSRTHGNGTRHFFGVLVKLLPEKFEELRGQVQDIHVAKGLIPIKKVTRVAGQLSWASSIFP